jgi:hypothetical protein
MRNICALVALSLVVGCGGGDGKDGSDGAPGPQGAAGPPGANGEDGEDGAPGTNGVNGADGAPGMDGSNGEDGSAILQGDGAPAASLGVDGDIYIDTVSRDVYQKANGTWSVVTNLSGGPPGPQGEKGDPGDDGMNGAPGTNGADGTSVLTGSGAPAAGLGNVGDVYIDSASGNLYSKGNGGWTLSGNLEGPAGDDGAPGADGVDVKDTLGGVRWFAFALSAGFADMPSLITSETYTDVSSAASFTFTGANQHGRLAFHTSGSFIEGGVDMSAFTSLDFSATISGPVNGLVVYLVDGANKGCGFPLTVAGPAYSVDIDNPVPSDCYNNTASGPDFDLSSVTGIQVGIVSSGSGARTLTITDIGLTAAP